jgi:hypothetical protein
VRRQHSTRPMRASATSTSRGYEEPTVWVALSTSTAWSPELGGRVLGTYKTISGEELADIVNHANATGDGRAPPNTWLQGVRDQAVGGWD